MSHPNNYSGTLYNGILSLYDRNRRSKRDKIGRSRKEPIAVCKSARGPHKEYMPYKDIIVGRPRQVQAGPWMSLVSVTSTERADVVSNCDANKGGLRVICNASSHVRIPGGCCRVWFSLSKVTASLRLGASLRTLLIALSICQRCPCLL